MRVDVHMHVYETTDLGRWWKGGYEIWEYGEDDGVRFGNHSGTIQDALTALDEGGFSHGITVNLFASDLFVQEAIDRLMPEVQGEDRRRAIEEIKTSLPNRLCEFNRWLCDSVAGVPALTPFVAADPWVLSADEGVAHLREMAESGARGIKIHPVVQRFEPSDHRMLPIFEACLDLDLTVLTHSGTSKGGEPYANPWSFAGLLERFPTLRLILAHLGGGSWHETAAFSEAFPSAYFDLSEIIGWTGAPGAPRDKDLAALIRRVGVHRVMLGSDFPWYDPGDVAERLLELPVLSQEEKETILGHNAVRLFNLPV